MPSPDPLAQALGRKVNFGKYRGKRFRWVVEHDLAYLHWAYRSRVGEETPLFLVLTLLCRRFPLGIDDETERELAAAPEPCVYPVKPAEAMPATEPEPAAQ